MKSSWRPAACWGTVDETAAGGCARPADAADAANFIRANLRLAAAPLLPELLLYTAHAGSGLYRLLDRASDPPPPYWAYPWAGGAALARYILDRPETASGKRVLDLGTGSGVVGIAAARSGASAVIASDIDPNAIVATRINAHANGVTVETFEADVTAHAPPAVDLILGGDVFYAPDVAARMSAFLERCRRAGIRVLVGDPGRADLPLRRLKLLAGYDVPDFGEGAGAARRSGVYAFDE